MPYGTSNWPAHFGTGTVYGRYVGMDSSVIVGSVTFTPRPAILKDYTDGVELTPTPITVQLDITGAFSIQLPATNDPDVRPEKWTYAVDENFSGGRPTFDIQVPLGSNNSLLDLSPAVPSIGIMRYVGPPGPPGVAAIGTFVPIASTPPDHTVVVAYLDSSTVPPTLKGWNGTAWVVLGGGSTGSSFTAVDNGDGTATITAVGTATIVDNGDATATLTGGTVTDNNDATASVA